MLFGSFIADIEGLANKGLDVGAPLVANAVVPGLGLFVVAGDMAIDETSLTAGEKLSAKEPELGVAVLPLDFLSTGKG